MTLALALAGGFLQAAPVMADQAERTAALPKAPASEKPVPGHGVKMLPRASDGDRKTPGKAPAHIWPASGTATVTLASGSKAGTASGTPGASSGTAAAGAAVLAGDLPISLRRPAAKAAHSAGTGAAASPGKGRSSGTPGPSLTGRTSVRVLDDKTAERAGVDGMLFSLQPQPDSTGGDVDVTVDYSAFVQAYGGGYASRLRLSRLPACAATTPDVTSCTTPTPVVSRNDTAGRTLTAGLTLPRPKAVSAAKSVSADATGAAPATLLAVTADASGDHGDYAATQLSASSTWQTNLNTGDFTWSYDMPAPSVPGDFAPQVGLSYSSGGIDGRTSNSNNQASWAGDGFGLWSGSISRSYKPCAEDGVKNADGFKPGDLCWNDDNAALSFNGHSGELISTGDNTFKLKNDDGTKVERLHGTDRDNGDNDQEYWQVTTTDGTRYYFGYNRLPGWTSGAETSDSTWTVPVYGDDDGEPCHKASFADSWCQQAWQWNLDYAVDARGNLIAYYYDKETNNYGRNLKPADETPYTRGGTLDRIEYGFKSPSVYAGKAPARVDFTSSERCLPVSGVTCAADTIDAKSFYWYDTPWDLNCAAGKDCTSSASPSFWTRNRLTDISTQVLKTDGTYAPVDEWKLNHRWGMADIDYQLLLDSVQHIGKSASPEITLPKVTFGYDQRANRLETPDDDTAPFIKERLATVSDESGGQTDVTYSKAACDANSLPAPQTNATRCYPVYFTKEGDEDPTRQWFNKYVVEAVTQTDRTRSSPDMVTRYSYLDGAAWHYDDDDGLTKEKYKTWSTWRGYSHVVVETGGQDPVGMKSQTDHYFLRGMDGDRAGPDGGKKTVTVSDNNGGTITDHDTASGFEYKTESYSGPGGRVMTRTVNTPWHLETAKRVRSWGTTTANLTGTAGTRTWTSLDDGKGEKWRVTSKTNTFENTAGRVVRTEDLGDESTAADDQCIRTTYVDNADAWILDAPSRAETVAVKCAATPNRSTDVVTDVRTAYDGQDYGKAPTRGDATRTANLKSHDGTTATYLESESSYDTYGRELTATEMSATVRATETTPPVRTARTDGLTTTTAYEPATGRPTSSTVTTPPATVGNSATTQTTTTTYEPIRGLATAVVDTNKKRTDTTFDALGRNWKIWLPNWPKSNAIPSFQYSYANNDQGPIAIGTKTLKNDGTQAPSSYTLLDGFLRTRQAQAPGPDGGRLISDTFYDERGLATKEFASYYDTAAPSASLSVPDKALAVETQTWTAYDGLARPVKSQEIAGNGDGGTVLSTTSTSYAGDRVNVTPPAGGTPTTTVTDARGNTTDLLQYHGATPTGAADTTHYTYTPAGALKSVTDPSGTRWGYTYDQRGNQIRADDPDKGVGTSSYDDRGQLVSTTDARNQTVTHLYDNLGRETETHDGTASGPLLTKKVWDPAGFKGQLASSTRYVGGASGSAYTTAYAMYDNLYRPNRTTVTVPSVAGEEGLAGSYQSNIKYNPDGTVQGWSYPQAGNLSAEGIVPGYDDIQRQLTLSGNAGTTYVTGTVYSYTGKPLQYTYKDGTGKKTQVTNSYEWGTQRLSNSRVDREDVAGTDKSATYHYDEAGNATSVSDVSRGGTDNQCFQYDYLGRMTQAWAQGMQNCAATPTGSSLGGPAPYWQSFTYDTSGNRTSQTLHDTTGDSSKDIRHTYGYPAPGGPQPHTLTKTDTTGPTGTATNTYTYDPTGNTATRTLGGDKQTLIWDAEGHLAQVTEPDGNGGTKTTSYVYDADGNRLLQRTDSGTTLYLDSTELTLAKGAGTAEATRYYDLGGGTQAVRTDDNTLSFLIGDPNGTSELAVNATTLSEEQRRSTPFGDPRGTPPASWPGSKGFVGGTKDATGLTHLGAREYDPSTGRFISVDPVLDVTDPQQMNGYTYSNSSPVSYSDPTGLRLACGPEFGLACPTSDKNGDGAPDNSGHNWMSHHSSESNPGSGPSYSPAVPPAVAKANTIKKIPVLQVVEKVGWDLFKGLIGLDDLEGCFSGGVTACISLLMGAIPFTAGFSKGWKLTKAAGRVGKAIWKWHREQKWADDILKKVDDLPSCVRPHSFLAGTKVLLDDGTTKPIEDVKTGDVVLVTDPETGKTTPKNVVATIVTKGDKDFTTLTVATPDGPAKLTATDTHPFWVPELGKWIEAGDLKPTQTLRTSAGTHVQITAVTDYTKRQQTYDLTVDDVHTYYVLAGTTPVLVHNIDEGDLCNLTLGPKLKGQTAEGVTAERGDTVLAHERRMINEFGDRNGCAACGAAKSGYKDGHWTGDHNPPNKLSPSGPWTLYPHCKACSKQQGGVVRTLIKDYYDFPVWKPIR